VNFILPYTQSHPGKFETRFVAHNECEWRYTIKGRKAGMFKGEAANDCERRNAAKVEE